MKIIDKIKAYFFRRKYVYATLSQSSHSLLISYPVIEFWDLTKEQQTEVIYQTVEKYKRHLKNTACLSIGKEMVSIDSKENYQMTKDWIDDNGKEKDDE